MIELEEPEMVSVVWDVQVSRDGTGVKVSPNGEQANVLCRHIHDVFTC